MMTLNPELGFDPDALREKYREERDKRIREDGNDQYREVTGDLARYVDDPNVEPGFTREPLTDEVEVVIVGGGFGGLLAGARLREAGAKDIRVIEDGSDFGGTWYWNRYPGSQCDIESYIYLPMLEEMGFVPKEKYSYADEILGHAQAIGRKYDLYSNVCFQTTVTALRWDEDSARWIISTNHGDRMKAHFVVLSNGVLNRPKLPGIPGIERFKGHSFHTSRWDYAYTGGDTSGNLTRLKGKRIGIIGTGATAIQCVPHLATWAEHLYVFQRTPSSVDARGNRPTDSGWVQGLKPGWQQERISNFSVLVSGGHQEEDLVNDGWTEIFHLVQGMLPRSGETDLSPEATEIADFKKMERIRARVDATVEDPATAEALKPYYRQFCKRPCFNDEYLQAFNRPNVTLVDTQGQGVTRITESGVAFGDTTYDVDCLIHATGFEVGTPYTRRAGYDVVGRDGTTLSDKWANGYLTLHGLHSHGFPNCFFMGITQTGISPNFTHMLNQQSLHIAYILGHCLDNNARTVEASAEAEAQFVDTFNQLASANLDFFETCSPGYYNNEGKPAERVGLQFSAYGGGAEAFFDILKSWRSEGGLRGLEIDYR